MVQYSTAGYKHSDLTGKIIGCAMKVHRVTGPGFPEIIYMRCMIIELRNSGLTCEIEVEKEIFYEGIKVGSRRLDLLVNNTVIVELKAVTTVEKVFYSQIINYLKFIFTGNRLVNKFWKYKFTI